VRGGFVVGLSEAVAGKMFLYIEMVAKDCSRKISM
jgi:hypothetical protein